MWRRLLGIDRKSDQEARRAAEEAAARAEADLRRTEQRWPEVRRLAKGLDKGLERNHIVETLLISIQRENPR
ncbi:hypothetical protein [Nocardia sp. NPDC005745]|uniref:DUF7620 family protein n=1 Tax=Nocardia sp. NPDC005745 TaxID=3157061 RepID=UPI0033E8F944